MTHATFPGLTSLKVATQPIFHYTSSIGLLGIAQAARLRASEAASLNDLAEVRSGWAKINAWLAKQPDSEVVELLRFLAEDPLKGRHEVFIACCSTSGDDANQWRLYADSATGYAVELDPAAPLVVVSNTAGPSSPGKAWAKLDGIATVTPWLHVLYADDEFEAATEEVLDLIEADHAKIGSGTGWDQEALDLAFEGLRDDAYEKLATIAHLVKAPGFRGENEVRAVATMVWQEAHILYRPGAQGVVGYVELTNEPPGHGFNRVPRPKAAGDTVPAELSIKSVRLGPLLQSEHTSTVKGMLRKFDLRKVGVLTSDVELR